MLTSSSEILDTAKLILGGDDFVPLDTEDLANVNRPYADKPVVSSGSIRTVEAYDPGQGCNVVALEYMGTGKDELTSGLSNAHNLILVWDDADRTTCSIDIDSGTCVDHDEGVIDLAKRPEWKARIVGALSMLVDECIGF